MKPNGMIALTPEQSDHLSWLLAGDASLYMMTGVGDCLGPIMGPGSYLVNAESQISPGDVCRVVVNRKGRLRVFGKVFLSRVAIAGRDVFLFGQLFSPLIGLVPVEEIALMHRVHNVTAKDLCADESSREAYQMLAAFQDGGLVEPIERPELLAGLGRSDALFAFDDWLEAYPNAPRDEIRKQAQTIVDDFRQIRYAVGVTELPVPRFVAKPREAIEAADIMESKEKVAAEVMAGRLTPKEAAREFATMRRWLDLLKYQKGK